MNTLYRVVCHYYLLGKKEGTLYSTVQVQMQLPTIMEEAEAYVSFLEAFRQGKPVGDGVGALTASRLMAGARAFSCLPVENKSAPATSAIPTVQIRAIPRLAE